MVVRRAEVTKVNIRALEIKDEPGSREGKRRFNDVCRSELLYEKKLIRKRNLPVKILGDGQLSKALEVSAHAFSKSAAEKIESIGGKTILL